MLSIDSNIDEIFAQIEELRTELDTRLAVVVDTILDEALINVKSDWPIASGDSLRGWSHRQESANHWVVFNAEDYTPFVHGNLAEELTIAAITQSVADHADDLEIPDE